MSAMYLGGLELGGISAVLRKEESEWKQVVTKKNKPKHKRGMGVVCRIIWYCGRSESHHEQFGEFEEIMITADSGAVDHVAPPSLAKGLPAKETKASRQGVHYIAANGSEIKNMGEQVHQGLDGEGFPDCHDMANCGS